jgi:hypothetical protein
MPAVLSRREGKGLAKAAEHAAAVSAGGDVPAGAAERKDKPACLISKLSLSVLAVVVL